MDGFRKVLGWFLVVSLVVRDNNSQEQWKQQNLQFYQLFTVFCCAEDIEKLLNITWFLWFFGVGFGTSSSSGFVGVILEGFGGPC